MGQVRQHRRAARGRLLASEGRGIIDKAPSYFATRGSGLSLVDHVLISRLGMQLGVLAAAFLFQGDCLISYCIRAVAARHLFTPTLLLGADTNDVADAVRTSASDPSFAAFKRGRLRLSETPLLTFAAQISVFPRPFPCLAPMSFSEARGRTCFEDVLSREK